MTVAMILGGLIVMMAGAEILVRGAVAIATRLKISPMVVGLTVVAFGTSAPELVVSVNAALSDAPGLAIGNVIGSNIANVMLILAATGLIYPNRERERNALPSFWAVFGFSILFAATMLTGTVPRIAGIGFLCLLAIYILVSYKRERRHAALTDDLEDTVEAESGLAGKSAPVIAAATMGGLVGVIFGADLLVDGAVILARDFGVPDEVIGLTIVAVGTSLPELATSVVAAIRKHSAVAIGNVIGSNIWNILLIVGAASTITPIAVPVAVIGFDIWVMLIATALIGLYIVTVDTANRTLSAAMLLAYFGFFALQYLGIKPVLFAL